MIYKGNIAMIKIKAMPFIPHLQQSYPSNIEAIFMKIQPASNLHLEFLQRDFPGERLIAPAHGVDILVLAGDIANASLPACTVR
jgi:hypothetical protein